MLFVGQGDALPVSKPEGVVKYRVYSLVDQKLLYTFGTDDPIAYRKAWQAYDASPLIDAETDTLIEPGENGVIYTIKLNTKWDPSDGVSVHRSRRGGQVTLHRSRVRRWSPDAERPQQQVVGCGDLCRWRGATISTWVTTAAG